MAYRKLGYTTVPEGRYVPETAERLMSELGESFIPTIKDCLDELGSARRFIGGLTLPDLLKMRSNKIEPGTQNHKDLVMIVNKILFHAGYTPDNIEKVSYEEKPVLTGKEVVGNMLTALLPWPSKDQFGGDKATLEVLGTHLPIIFRELRYTAKLRQEFNSRLRAKLGDIGHKIMMQTPITQEEKTFYLTYCNVEKGAHGEDFGSSSGSNSVRIPAAQTSDPLVTEAFDLYRKMTEPGPGLRRFQLLSNKSLESLVWYYGPYARTLPFSIGYEAKFGPFTEHRMTPLDNIAWTPEDQMIGIRDQFQLIFDRTVPLPIKEGPPNPAEAIGLSRDYGAAWQLDPPTRICGNQGQTCKEMFIDLPNVTLRLANELDIADYTWEYYSEWRSRMVTSEAGATEMSLYTDIALTNERAGEGAVDRLNIDDFGIADFNESVTSRKLVNDDNRILEQIYYVRNGNQLESTAVDMTDFYSRQGIVAYRPAFAEYMITPRMWFFKDDMKASEFIASWLGLTREQRFRNRIALTLSHNAAVLQRVTGTDGHFDIVATIKAVMNLL